MEIRRYLRGWIMFCYALKKARSKKHGAGKQRWLHAYRTAQCMRYIVDGQFRGSKGPRFMRKMSIMRRIP